MADPNQALQVLAPEVRTLARPASGPLLGARGVIQRSEAIRALFVQAKAEGWEAERLAEAIAAPLEEALEASPADVRQAALYLAAEHLQFGETLLLVSRETGRAIARVTDDDIWQPPPVPRESGGMAKPLPRLRPELEGFLYEVVHEHNREAEVQAALAIRTQQTAYLATEGDRRLNVSHKQGRRAIEQEIQARGDKVLDGATGLTADLLRLFEASPRENMTLVATTVAMARSRVGITDPFAINYRFDHAAGQYHSLVNEWVREIARGISLEAHARTPVEVLAFNDVAPEHVRRATLWVCDPALAGAFFRLPGVSVLHVPGVKPFGLTGSSVGALVPEPGSLKVEGRELFNHWDVMGRFSYTLYLDWSKVTVLDVVAPPVTEYVAEVLPR